VLWKGKKIDPNVSVIAIFRSLLKVEFHISIVLRNKLYIVYLDMALLLLFVHVAGLVNPVEVAERNREELFEERRQSLRRPVREDRWLEDELVICHDQVAFKNGHMKRGLSLALDLVQPHQLLLAFFYLVHGQALNPFLYHLVLFLSIHASS
jgi:hypothetical protein